MIEMSVLLLIESYTHISWNSRLFNGLSVNNTLASSKSNLRFKLVICSDKANDFKNSYTTRVLETLLHNTAYRFDLCTLLQTPTMSM